MDVGHLSRLRDGRHDIEMHERMSGALNASLCARLIAWSAIASSGRGGGVDVGHLSRLRDGRHVVEMYERISTL